MHAYSCAMGLLCGSCAWDPIGSTLERWIAKDTSVQYCLMANGCSMHFDGCRPSKVPGVGMLTIALQFQCSSPSTLSAMYMDVRVPESLP